MNNRRRCQLIARSLRDYHGIEILPREVWRFARLIAKEEGVRPTRILELAEVRGSLQDDMVECYLDSQTY